jgi:sortase A
MLRLLVLCGLLLVSSALAGLGRYQEFQASSRQSPVLGHLEIPRLHFSIAILDDDDPDSLALGAGHIPGTSPIGSLGNAGVAGHRDTAFRALRFIRLGDRIEARTNRLHTYIVESIHIVDPSDTTLLQLNTTPTLTLVTCYPFNYVGPAPKRFVIQARLR